jgi:DNA-binding transcriptional ArsR family regulator
LEDTQTIVDENTIQELLDALASVTVRTLEQYSTDVQSITGEDEIQQLLDALDDADCRAILDETSENVLTAAEVSETCDLPLSTAYRKLDFLTEAGLLEEQTRIRESGKHASEYTRLNDEIIISLGPRGEIEARMSHDESHEQTGSPLSITGD